MTRKSESPAILSPVFHGIARPPTLLAASVLRVDRAAAEDHRYALAAAGRCADPPEVVGTGSGAAAVRLSTPAHPIAAGRHRAEPHKKLYGLYREERLIVRKRGGRKRALGTRAPMALPQGLNQRWSLDFVSDALACDSSANGGKCAVYLHTVLMGRHTVLMLHGGCTKICA
jgi:hypothetical protein